MILSLTKGANLSLTKEFPSLKLVRFGLGWDAKSTDTGVDFDLDASAFMLNNQKKLLNTNTGEGFIFYNQPSAIGIQYGGDNRTGSGEGDDETLDVDLNSLQSTVESVMITATIYHARSRKQNFGQVKNAYIRLIDAETGTELVRYDLSEDFGTETALMFGELYRHNGEWKFRAVGQGYTGGLSALAGSFGLNIQEEV